MPINRWMHQQIWEIYTMEPSQQQQWMNELLTHMAAWMNLKIIILTERSQIKNSTYLLHDTIYIIFQSAQTNP